MGIIVHVWDKYPDALTLDEAIAELNLPTAVPYIFEFDEGLGYVKDYFLGDPEEIAALQSTVAAQGKRG